LYIKLNKITLSSIENTSNNTIKKEISLHGPVCFLGGFFLRMFGGLYFSSYSQKSAHKHGYRKR